jgi:hypothetical protein
MKPLILLFAFLPFLGNSQTLTVSDTRKLLVDNAYDTSLAICVNGKGRKEISMSELKNQDFSFGFCNSENSKKFEIIGYVFVHSPKDTINEHPYYQSVTGYKLATDIKTQLKSAKPGDHIIFTNIMAEGANRKRVEAKGAVLTVVP